MKPFTIWLLVLMLLTPTLALAEGEHEAAKHGVDAAKWIVKGMEQAVEHKEKVAAAVVGTNVGLQPAGHKPVAIIAASGKSSGALATALISLAVYGTFAAIIAYHIIYYDELNKHPAFAGQAWDTCANTTINTPSPHCKPFLNGRAY